MCVFCTRLSLSLSQIAHGSAKQVVESQSVLLRKLFNHFSSICKFNSRKKRIFAIFMNEFDCLGWWWLMGFFSLVQEIPIRLYGINIIQKVHIVCFVYIKWCARLWTQSKKENKDRQQTNSQSANVIYGIPFQSYQKAKLMH